MAAPVDSVWGSINTCLEIGLEIYQLYCECCVSGEKKCGITLPADKANEILSEKALSQGVEQDGFIYFESPNRFLAPLFELLKSAKINDQDFINSVGGIDGVEQSGRAANPEYFGSLPLPDYDIPFDANSYVKSNRNEVIINEIRSGLSIVKNDELRFVISVHKTLAERDLTAEALRYSHQEDDFYIFAPCSCAIALHELSIKYPEINEAIRHRESMVQTIITEYPNYAEYWNNNHAEQGEKIKPNGSLSMMFLQEHYDFEADRTQTAVSEFIENERARELDNGFEPYDEELEIG
jgi:hypothetical protein